MKAMKKNYIKALASILVANLVGITSSLLSGDVRSRYAELSKPLLSPPGWLFGVVWPVLFVLMGYAAYRISVNGMDMEKRRKALFLYAVQLILNFSWSIVFFRFGSPWGGLVIVVLLSVLVFQTIRIFGEIDRTAGWLMVPYLLWLFFAAYLNAGIIGLN